MLDELDELVTLPLVALERDDVVGREPTAVLRELVALPREAVELLEILPVAEPLPEVAEPLPTELLCAAALDCPRED